MRLLVILLFLFFLSKAYADDCDTLFQDLEIVEKIDAKLNKKLPLLFNYQQQVGYFTMPSARMAEGGELAFSFSYAPPYHIYGLLFQLFSRLELTGNYWVYKGIEEKHFGSDGFGDDAERAANFKFSLLRKSDGIPELPEFALGLNDFIGTQRFRSFYVVGTQTFNSLGLELTLGWGTGRIDGFFGGFAYTPFSTYQLLKGLSLVAEWDANDYKKHSSEHPSGRTVKSRINVGIQWSFFDSIILSASTLRGEKIAASAAIAYNFGTTEGLFPKLYNPLPYTAPIDTQAIGELRTRKEFAHELAYAMQEQGLPVYSVIYTPCKNDSLWLKLVNIRYREEEIVRDRVQNALSSLLPSNIKEVDVVIEAEGVAVHQYHYTGWELEKYRNKKLSEPELRIISPLQEIQKKPSKYDSATLFQRKKSLWEITFRPIFSTYFGSSSGKLKADVGITLGIQGYLWDEIYYVLNGSYTFLSNAHGLGSFDRLNPSQIINVRSDSVLYRQSNSVHLDQAFIQKSFTLKKGWFTRLSAGYFETAYAGIASEFLYYPVQSNWAVGVEAAYLFKRGYHGISLDNTIRKLQGFTPTYVRYRGRQYFLNFYYHFPFLHLDAQLRLGEFLAHDKGVRIDLSRIFSSGLRLGLWYTVTNGNDQIGGKQYFDKGFFISLPLDIFMNRSSKTRVHYSMAAWLRDVGAIAETGKRLYPIIRNERYNDSPTFY